MIIQVINLLMISLTIISIYFTELSLKTMYIHVALTHNWCTDS